MINDELLLSCVQPWPL